MIKMKSNTFKVKNINYFRGLATSFPFLNFNIKDDTVTMFSDFADNLFNEAEYNDELGYPCTTDYEDEFMKELQEILSQDTICILNYFDENTLTNQTMITDNSVDYLSYLPDSELIPEDPNYSLYCIAEEKTWEAQDEIEL